MEGSKVRIIHAGYDRTVPTCRVIHFKDEKYLEDEQTNTEVENYDDPSEPIVTQENVSIVNEENISNDASKENASKDDEISNREVRPKPHSNIAYKVIEYEHWRRLKISAVGKKDRNKKFRCCMKYKNNTETFDYVNDISE